MTSFLTYQANGSNFGNDLTPKKRKNNNDRTDAARIYGTFA